MEDYRALALNLWEAGRLKDDPVGDEARGRVLCLTELQTLDLGSIKRFYEEIAVRQQGIDEPDSAAVSGRDGSEAG